LLLVFIVTGSQFGAGVGVVGLALLHGCSEPQARAAEARAMIGIVLGALALD
jgi:hypothetical protein